MVVQALWHRPVLFKEVIDGLEIQGQSRVVDCTFGRGGHSTGLLERLGVNGALLALDRDPDALGSEAALKLKQDPRVILRQANFAALNALMDELGWLGTVDAIVMDLGVSSPQLDDAGRGFSFLREGPLDMRMDPKSGESAAQWLSRSSEAEIRRVLKEYGEERFAGRIAAAIIRQRRIAPIETTTGLARLVEEAVPYRDPAKHPATRTFQAIRIAVNEELDALKEGLSQAIDALRPGGRLAVIAFHSLEDRIVKRFLRDQERGWSAVQRSRLPEAPAKQVLRRIGGAVMPGPDEIALNVRARSAVLRLAEKL